MDLLQDVQKFLEPVVLLLLLQPLWKRWGGIISSGLSDLSCDDSAEDSPVMNLPTPGSYSFALLMSGTLSNLSIAWESSNRPTAQNLGYLPNLCLQGL
ncbi:hypothetical protein V6N13_148480 [Hibiscus sabdariffa]